MEYEFLLSCFENLSYVANLFASCLYSMDNHYDIIDMIEPPSCKETLAKELATFDALDGYYRPLSELLLQRKITETDDKLKVAIEVENALWQHGRIQIDKEANRSRASGNIESIFELSGIIKLE